MHVQFEQETFDGAIGAIVQALQEIRGRVERGEVVLGAEQEAELQRLHSPLSIGGIHKTTPSRKC